MKGFIEFIRTQGVIGLAVGFILGKAISDLVGSIVKDLINPIIGIALGRFGDLTTLEINILSAHITYGNFISLLINFVIVALVVYFGIKKLGLDKLDKPKV
ncbi:MAG: MscL family protein [Candidatus Taylorbacteria bacterium]|nr:MscL family protein [Candidatus Taylorbacteria bacterium]